MNEKSTNVLLACSGSVASIKLSPLILNIKEQIANVNLSLIVTENSKHFINCDEIKEELGVDIYDDESEWTSWKNRKKVLHIELRKWADILVIAPLDANTLSKISNGQCDNLISCVTRAWEIPVKKPIIVCPAMNTAMWQHPITDEHISRIQSWGYTAVLPVAKTFVCGDTGIGAMADVKEIVEILKLSIARKEYDPT